MAGFLVAVRRGKGLRHAGGLDGTALLSTSFANHAGPERVVGPEARQHEY